MAVYTTTSIVYWCICTCISHLLYTGVYVHVYHIYCILVYMYMYITSIVYWCICTCISHLLYTGVYVHVYHIYCIRIDYRPVRRSIQDI